MNSETTHCTWRALGAALIGAVLAGLGALLFAVFDGQSTKLARVVWEAAPWAVFVVMPLGFTLILWLRDHVFPWTDGTGIPQTIAVLQAGPGELRERLLSMRVALGKALLLGLGMFSFLSIGREGPSVQLGACFMHLVGKWTAFPRHLMERGLIMAGGAAGIAAAFNAPIAGIVFAFEEIGRRFDKENLGTIVRTVMVAQRAAATMMVLLTGIPGGLFDPSFSIGAGLGHLTAPWLTFSGATVQGIILLWVVSYFSGVVQSPMTAFIILIEMTGAVAFTVPLGLASIVAYEASRRVCPVALYEVLAANFLRAGEPVDGGPAHRAGGVMDRPGSP
jgi:H+/Cl- antiporter ClcA